MDEWAVWEIENMTTFGGIINFLKNFRGLKLVFSPLQGVSAYHLNQQIVREFLLKWIQYGN